MALLPSPFGRSSGVMVIGLMLTMLRVSSAVAVRRNMISVPSDATFKSDSGDDAGTCSSESYASKEAEDASVVLLQTNMKLSSEHKAVELSESTLFTETHESEGVKTDLASLFQSSHARPFHTGRRSDVAHYEHQWSEDPDQLQAAHFTFNNMLSEFTGDGIGIKQRANVVDRVIAIAIFVAVAIAGSCIFFRSASPKDAESLNTPRPDQLPISAPAKADEDRQPFTKVPVDVLEKVSGEAEQETNAEPMRIVQRPMGICCCSDGFIALVRSSKADAKNALTPLPEAVASDALVRSSKADAKNAPAPLPGLVASDALDEPPELPFVLSDVLLGDTDAESWMSPRSSYTLSPWTSPRPDHLPMSDENRQPVTKVPVDDLDKGLGDAKQKPMGICGSDGFLALVRSSKADAKNALTPLPEAVASVALDESPCSELPFVPNDTHPNFTGTFKCVKADGDIDGFMKDIEMGWMIRSAAASYKYGAGYVTRVYQHTGMNLKQTETGLGDSVTDYVIDGKERIFGGDAPFLFRMWWDENEPHVLFSEGKDVEKAKPSVWTWSRQWFMDADNMVVESRSASGCVARWIYQRKVGA